MPLTLSDLAVSSSCRLHEYVVTITCVEINIDNTFRSNSMIAICGGRGGGIFATEDGYTAILNSLPRKSASVCCCALDSLNCITINQNARFGSQNSEVRCPFAWGPAKTLTALPIRRLPTSTSARLPLYNLPKCTVILCISER